MIRLATLHDGWNAFWFRPESALPVAVFRIVIGVLLLLEAAFLSPELLMFFGPHGIVSRSTALSISPGINVLAMLPATDASVIVFFALYVAAVVGMTLGYRTRICTILTFVGLSSLQNADCFILNASDNLLRLFTLLLIFAPAGARLSLDARRRAPESPEPLFAPWAQRLIQLQLSLMYLNTVGWKTDGTRWLDGSAVYYATQSAQFKGFPIPYLLSNMTTIHALTWGTMAVELALGVLVWVRETRTPVLICGVIFHLGLTYCMNLPFFEWIVLAPYVLFLRADELEKLAATLRRLYAHGFIRRKRSNVATSLEG